MGHQMLVAVAEKTLADPVAHVPNDDQDNVGDIGAQEDIVWRVLLHDVLERRTGRMSRGMSVSLVGAVPKLDVSGSKDCLRGRRDALGTGEGRVELEHVVVRICVGQRGSWRPVSPRKKHGTTDSPKDRAGVELGVTPGLVLAFLSARIMSSSERDAVGLPMPLRVPAKRLFADVGE
jgi:hypothetical protein